MRWMKRKSTSDRTPYPPVERCQERVAFVSPGHWNVHTSVGQAWVLPSWSGGAIGGGIIGGWCWEGRGGVQKLCIQGWEPLFMTTYAENVLVTVFIVTILYGVSC